MLGIYVRTSIDKIENESSIEQQKQAGRDFAKKHNYHQYQIYEDKGISGFKISGDEKNPFENRPGMMELIKDIKSKKIKIVWVWEHSRLSRNQGAFAIIFNVFEKYDIKVFEKDKEFNVSDPQVKMIQGILSSVSEYERNLIASRAKRGLHHKINQGKRTFGKLYGYRKIDVDSKGFQVLGKVDSEMENIKYGYKRVLEGATLRQLTLELHNNKSFDNKEALRVSRVWYKILTHFSYTGYELNMAGIEEMRKFNNFEIDSLSHLINKQYYVESQNHKHELITIEKWIKVAERLRINRKIRKKYKLNRASRDLATGLIKCSECDQSYYSYTHERKHKNKSYYYNYYKHYAAMQNAIQCKQKKSFLISSTDEIFKLFFFYFYLIFDNTEELLQESQRIIKTQRFKLLEQIKQYERNAKQYEKQIEKFNLALGDSDDTGEIRILARRIDETEENIKINYEVLSNLKISLEQLDAQYQNTETANAYYNVKDKIRRFFNEMQLEERRDELIKSVKVCLVFSPYLVIDTGTVLFVFDTRLKYKFKEEMLDNLDKDKVYKTFFIDKLTDDFPFLDSVDNDKERIQKDKIFNIDEVKVYDCKLTKQYRTFNTLVAEQMLKKYKIDYSFLNHVSVLFFTNDYLE
jgi:DNA invertase Pin-like site-specific DNA recombinase